MYYRLFCLHYIVVIFGLNLFIFMQRAKLKEIAAQRAMQLRQEEEERAKEQKAKALAKLEELDRRTSALPTIVETSGHDNVVSLF